MGSALRVWFRRKVALLEAEAPRGRTVGAEHATGERAVRRAARRLKHCTNVGHAQLPEPHLHKATPPGGGGRVGWEAG